MHTTWRWVWQEIEYEPKLVFASVFRSFFVALCCRVNVSYAVYAIALVRPPSVVINQRGELARCILPQPGTVLVDSEVSEDNSYLPYGTEHRSRWLGVTSTITGREYNCCVVASFKVCDNLSVEQVQRCYTKRLRGYANCSYSERLHSLNK